MFGALKRGFRSMATCKECCWRTSTEKNTCGIARFPCGSTAFLFVNSFQFQGCADAWNKADHRQYGLTAVFSDDRTSLKLKHWNSFAVLQNMPMRLKQFQCFISVFISPCATGLMRTSPDNFIVHRFSSYPAHTQTKEQTDKPIKAIDSSRRSHTGWPKKVSHPVYPWRCLDDSDVYSDDRVRYSGWPTHTDPCYSLWLLSSDWLMFYYHSVGLRRSLQLTARLEKVDGPTRDQPRLILLC